MSYISEAEQVEQIKKWLREYGVAALVGILIALVLGYGWRYWNEHREMQLAHASMRYEQLLTNVVNGNVTAAQNQANRLMSRYPHTPYAELAALQLARVHVYQTDLASAKSELRWVMRHGDNASLRELARIRLARVTLASDEPQVALSLLNESDDKAYTAASLEVRGDILVKLGRLADARAAYEAALKTFPGISAIQPLLQMKIDNLAGAKNTGAA